MRKTIPPHSVRPGMYVHGFEGSWFDRPFWRTGFEIDDEQTLSKIRESAVEGVIVEWTPESDEPPRPASTTPSLSSDAAAAMIRRAVQTIGPRQEHRERAEPPEIQHGRAVMKRARSALAPIFETVRAGGSVPTAEAAAIADDMAQAVLLNPDAMIKVTRVKSRNDYGCTHALAVCTLMINLARALNLPESSYRALGMAGLLHDVGELAIDEALLKKPGSLSDAEFEEIKRHTVHGHALLARSGDMPEAVLDVCLHHHERINGTGYPFGLAGDQISLHARMAGICDIYDALTSTRPFKRRWTPLDALEAMRSWEGHLDPELLFQFMRSIGMFLPGALVELRSRRLGIILPQGARSGMAKARAFYCLRSRDFLDPVDIELGESLRHDLPLREVEPAQFGFEKWDGMKAVILAGGDPRPIGDEAA